MTPTPDAFFDYHCDRCGAPFCERVQIMNLALGYVDETLCLACLSAELSKPEPDVAHFAWAYVQARDCFKDPWLKFNASACPRLESHTCYCQKP